MRTYAVNRNNHCIGKGLPLAYALILYDKTARELRGIMQLVETYHESESVTVYTPILYSDYDLPLY